MTIKQLIFAVLASAAALCVPTVAAATVPPDLVGAYCSGGAHPATSVATDGILFSLDADGRVTTQLRKNTDSPAWIHVPLGSHDWALALVQFVDAKGEQRGDTCVDISPGATDFALPELPNAADPNKLDTYWRVTILMSPQGAPPKPLEGSPERDKLLLRIRQAGRSAVYSKVVSLWAAAGWIPQGLPNDTYMVAFADAAESAHDKIMKKLTSASDPEREAAEACAQDVAALESLAQHWKGTADADITARASARKELSQKLMSFLTTAAAIVPPDEEEWAARAEFEALKDPAGLPAWVFGTFEFPMSASGYVLQLDEQSAQMPRTSLEFDTAMVAWATTVPSADTTRFEWKAGPARDAPVAWVLVNAIGLLPGIGSGISLHAPPVAAAVAPVVNKSMEALTILPPVKSPTPGMNAIFKTIAGSGLRGSNAADLLRPGIYPFAPMAKFTSRVGLSRVSGDDHLLPGRDYEVSTCNIDCASTSNVRSHMTVDIPSGLSAALVGTVTYDLCGGGACEDSLFSSFEWEPTTSAGPTQQVYRLETKHDGFGQVSASLLLAMLFPEHLWGRAGIAAGPTLLSGSTNPARQWNVALLLAPRVMERNYFYFTTGPGLRIDGVPAVDRPGQHVVVQTMNGTATPPGAPVTRTVYDFVWSFGIAINLSSPVADYAPKLFSGDPSK